MKKLYRWFLTWVGTLAAAGKVALTGNAVDNMKPRINSVWAKWDNSGTGSPEVGAACYDILTGALRFEAPHIDDCCARTFKLSTPGSRRHRRWGFRATAAFFELPSVKPRRLFK